MYASKNDRPRNRKLANSILGKLNSLHLLFAKPVVVQYGELNDNASQNSN